jgi:CMP-N-acetylneuraminic acid synthetase
MRIKSKILALIPARAGSKGIKNKNIACLGGFPLIAWTIREALKSKFISHLIVSTDSVKIAEIARQYGCHVPFMRPKILAGDQSPTVPVLLHALRRMEKDVGRFSHVVLLQPTSPFRTVDDIDHGIELSIKSNADSLVSVSEAKTHPFLAVRLDSSGIVKSFLPNRQCFVRRQKFPSAYQINGMLYVTKRDVLIKEKTLFPSGRTLGFVTAPENSFDIDTPEDLLMAETILSHRYVGTLVGGKRRKLLRKPFQHEEKI